MRSSRCTRALLSIGESSTAQAPCNIGTQGQGGRALQKWRCGTSKEGEASRGNVSGSLSMAGVWEIAIEEMVRLEKVMSKLDTVGSEEAGWMI